MNKETLALLPRTDNWTQEQYNRQAARRVSPWSERLLLESGWTHEQVAALPNNAEALIELNKIAKRD